MARRLTLLVAAGSLVACAGAPSAFDSPAPPTEEGKVASAPPSEATARDGSAQQLALPADPELRARLLRLLSAVVGEAFSREELERLSRAPPPYSGRRFWIPGTGEASADRPGARAMGAVPEGLGRCGPSIDVSQWSPQDPFRGWVGLPVAQSRDGELFRRLSSLSALQVFDTAWPDAQRILAAHGPELEGAWLVGHSAGALPAILAGLVGRAHRVDVYGVPSAVGTLDGSDGLLNLRTHPLDPVGAMGFLGKSGKAEIDFGGIAARSLASGHPMDFHDYASFPTPELPWRAAGDGCR